MNFRTKGIIVLIINVIFLFGIDFLNTLHDARVSATFFIFGLIYIYIGHKSIQNKERFASLFLILGIIVLVTSFVSGYYSLQRI